MFITFAILWDFSWEKRSSLRVPSEKIYWLCSFYLICVQWRRTKAALHIFCGKHFPPYYTVHQFILGMLTIWFDFFIVLLRFFLGKLKISIIVNGIFLLSDKTFPFCHSVLWNINDHKLKDIYLFCHCWWSLQ